MEQTTNLGLKKSGYDDFGDVEVLNENWDKVDEAIAATDPTKVSIKAKPADTDGVMLLDSADGGKTKRLLWSSVKTALNKLFVPLTRKINNKPLSADVTLTASDVNAYSKTEMDTKMSSAVTTDNIMNKLGTVPIDKGGTGVTSMTGSDYSTNRPRGIVLATAVPTSVPNGCVVLVASEVSS
ncbi:hypothetical protein [uncultured Agathobaculum sp.]|uniref:hypothetical protein n=1 Tax=uncultured Agathobaculum sp. TaxID=2048140 RepID=UPI00296F66FD